MYFLLLQDTIKIRLYRSFRKDFFFYHTRRLFLKKTFSDCELNNYFRPINLKCRGMKSYSREGVKDVMAFHAVT